MVKRVDPDFKKKFGVKTPIYYLQDVSVDKEVAEKFQRAWKRFRKKADPIVSKTREKQFDAFFRQLKKDGTDDRYCKRVTIRHISSKVGSGVFATEDIPPYSTLHHYAGVLMWDDEINPDHDSTFSFSDLKNYSIDAMKSGNWTRFMNHSDEGSETNNVIPWEYYSEEGPRIVFTSGAHGIKKGEQLLYSYGESYWEEKGKFVRF